MSFNTLVKVAGCGALLVCGASSFAQWKIQSNLKEGLWFSESMRLLRAHRGAKALLGEPIIDGDLNLASPKDNFCDLSLAQFRVPVQGPKEKGYLYLWASRPERQWRVDRLELELASDASRRLLVHNRVEAAVDSEGGGVQPAGGDVEVSNAGEDSVMQDGGNGDSGESRGVTDLCVSSPVFWVIRPIPTECKSANRQTEANVPTTQTAKSRGEAPGSGATSDRESTCDEVDSKSALQHILHLSRSEGAGTSQTKDDDQFNEEGEDQEPLTQVELTSVFRNTLSSLLSEDPLLSDLADMALNPAVVKSLIALEKGTAMAILVNRSHKVTRVIVERTATVRDLKTAIRSAVELEQERKRRGRRRAISWRYVWRANWLCFGGKQLKDDNARLSELGMSNKSEVCFVQRIRRKRGQLTKKAGQLQD